VCERISHSIAAEVVRQLISEGFQKTEKIEESSREQGTVILTKGLRKLSGQYGHSNWRHDRALEEYLGYHGDVNLLVEGERDDIAKDTVARRAKEFEDMGNMGVEIFRETIQTVCQESNTGFVKLQPGNGGETWYWER